MIDFRRFFYTDEHKKFIRINYTDNPNCTRREMVISFNKHFGLNINTINLNYVIDKYDLARQRKHSIIFDDDVKLFITKCIEDGMSKKDCKKACDLEFRRSFNFNTIGQIANKLGLHFRFYPKTKADLFFENTPDIEKVVRKIIMKNSTRSYNYQLLLLRDEIISKYELNLTLPGIAIYCNRKDIELNE